VQAHRDEADAKPFVRKLLEGFRDVAGVMSSESEELSRREAMAVTLFVVLGAIHAWAEDHLQPWT
jgi:hypothetical protein